MKAAKDQQVLQIGTSSIFCSTAAPTTSNPRILRTSCRAKQFSTENVRQSCIAHDDKHLIPNQMNINFKVRCAVALLAWLAPVSSQAQTTAFSYNCYLT